MYDSGHVWPRVLHGRVWSIRCQHKSNLHEVWKVQGHCRMCRMYYINIKVIWNTPQTWIYEEYLCDRSKCIVMWSACKLTIYSTPHESHFDIVNLFSQKHQEINTDSENNVTMERQTLYCVPIPGETDWVKTISFSRGLQLL